MKCATCGHLVTNGDVFCNHCGSKIQIIASDGALSSSKSKSPTKILVAVGSAIAILAVAVAVIALIGSHKSTTAQSSGARLPGLVICAGTPTFKPTTMSWCSSACSSYIKGISWSNWTMNSARGIGTLMTNDGVPNCAQGTWTAHANYVVTLSYPRNVTYCDGTSLVTRLLFTSSDYSGKYQIPMFQGPTC